MKNVPKCQYEDFLEFSEQFSEAISHVIYTQTPDRLFKKPSLIKASSEDLSMESVIEVVDYLSKLKKTYNLDVIMVGMLPPLAKSPINWSYRTSLESQSKNIISENAIFLTKYVDTVFTEKLAIEGIPYFDKMHSFKLNLPDDLYYNGHITYSDNRHISDVGEELFGQRFISYMNEQGYMDF